MQAKSLISLPSSVNLTDFEINYIADKIKEFLIIRYISYLKMKKKILILDDYKPIKKVFVKKTKIL